MGEGVVRRGAPQMADYKDTDALKELNKYHSIYYGVTTAGAVGPINSWLQRG
jgi:hypothetical protein